METKIEPWIQASIWLANEEASIPGIGFYHQRYLVVQGKEVVGAPLDAAHAVGVRGYYAGPGVHLLDRNALTDPLLARLPMVSRDPDYATMRRSLGLADPAPPWRIGHFARAVPAGYLATLLAGENRITDPEIRSLWDRVATVTRGPVFEVRRLGTVARWLLDGGRLNRPRPEWRPLDWEEALTVRPHDAGLLFGRASVLTDPASMEAALDKTFN